MRSSITFAIAALLAAAVQCSAHSGYGGSRHPRYENCAPSQNGSCTGCGTDYVQCGSNTCYNPKAGETCCSNAYGKRRASFNCRYEDNYDDDYNSTTTSVPSTTTTITSTTTNTITVSATTSSCALTSSTTGLPITSSVASYGNTTTVALNTTTSTLSVANATGVLPTSNMTLNATKPPSATISPPISGYKGDASGLQGQASASLFALNCLIFMCTLLL
ncbi:hypothetical protein PV05_05690 [Exophiala xenobiotica]|uniref:Uncharacterized protein n=1 Tax=Exophiala xenobiotica TaxID=348802 RepID=A0A0D2BXF4_9EURO|nr:uncharacterized protein PV05_05690 [Exophiala xenobiotica]KIW57091.1 hypothetical protein PV05_05690 [Exophiala xenobiotica]